jgi:hypothetical protein
MVNDIISKAGNSRGLRIYSIATESAKTKKAIQSHEHEISTTTEIYPLDLVLTHSLVLLCSVSSLEHTAHVPLKPIAEKGRS